MKILIPIEICSREFLYKTFLSHLLALEGFECYFGTKRNISFLLNKFENFIYLDKGYHRGVSDVLYERIKNRNGIIINLDEEGAIDFPDGSTLKSRYSTKLFEASTMVFLWGNYQKRLLEELSLQKNKMLVTGHPRFELLKTKYHHIYQDKVSNIKNRFNKFILINSNFGFGNNIKGDEFVLNNYGSRVKRVKEIVIFDKVKRETYIKLVKNLAQKFEINIIYRPHPEEEIATYVAAFKNLTNVFVVHEGSVVPWIIAAEVMIHPDCTTGIEAFMVGKKSISFIPTGYNPNIVAQLPLDISYRLESINDVINFIHNEEYRINSDQEKDFNIIDTYFSFRTESSKEIVKFICKAKECIKNNYLEKLSVKDRLTLNAIGLKLKMNNSAKTRLSKNKLKEFEITNLRSLKRKIELINDEFGQIKCDQVSHQLFKIYK
jgi:surface carbohydrate biosynthesis protein